MEYLPKSKVDTKIKPLLITEAEPGNPCLYEPDNFCIATDFIKMALIYTPGYLYGRVDHNDMSFWCLKYSEESENKEFDQCGHA